MTEINNTNNTNKKSTYDREYYLANRDKQIKASKKWQQANRERYIANSSKPLKKKFEALQNGTLNYSIYCIKTPEGYYFGCHNHLDGKFGDYWGSGTTIKNVIAKYGKEKCERKIIYTVYNAETARLVESVVIKTAFEMGIPTLNKIISSGYYKREFTVNNKLEN